jgi:hypothetical protein|tara:strand:+ start:980 stop:1180 length:201 start_codon:yes stop_codon:yes gene_type:complete
MKLPFYLDTKSKREDLNIKGLFKHCDELLEHLTAQERDQYRRYLTNEFKLKRDQRRNEVGFRNWYK